MAERGSVREITNDEGKRSCGAVEPRFTKPDARVRCDVIVWVRPCRQIG